MRLQATIQNGHSGDWENNEIRMDGPIPQPNVKFTHRSNFWPTDRTTGPTVWPTDRTTGSTDEPTDRTTGPTVWTGDRLTGSTDEPTDWTNQWRLTGQPTNQPTGPTDRAIIPPTDWSIGQPQMDWPTGYKRPTEPTADLANEQANQPTSTDFNLLQKSAKKLLFCQFHHNQYFVIYLKGASKVSLFWGVRLLHILIKHFRLTRRISVWS